MSKRIKNMCNNAPDDFQTPALALKPLVPFISKESTVWECAEGKGNLTREFSRLGYKVIGSDKLSSHDFLFWQPEHYDVIVTNPPYSIKEKFLERCYKLGKPFALLMPLTALESQSRQKLYTKYGLQMILFPKRINFETPKTKGSGAWFATAWYTFGLKLPRDLNFVNTEFMNKDQSTLFHELTVN
jgi:hypothetical protein